MPLPLPPGGAWVGFVQAPTILETEKARRKRSKARLRPMIVCWSLFDGVFTY